MKVTRAQLESAIWSTIVGINNAAYRAGQAGIVLNLPEQISFNIDVIHTANLLDRIQTSLGDPYTDIVTEAAAVDTQVNEPYTDVTINDQGETVTVQSQREDTEVSDIGDTIETSLRGERTRHVYQSPQLIEVEAATDYDRSRERNVYRDEFDNEIGNPVWEL